MSPWDSAQSACLFLFGSFAARPSCADVPASRPFSIDARDRYGRLLAVCYVGGENLNERTVREGRALDFHSYSTDYLQAEAEAKRAGVGIWRGDFTPPWEWRAACR